MNNKGFVHIVVPVAIFLIAAVLVGVSFYYEANKYEGASTSVVKNANASTNQSEYDERSYCTTSNDCGLNCDGCWAKDWLNNNRPICIRDVYPSSDYTCSCQENVCIPEELDSDSISLPYGTVAQTCSVDIDCVLMNQALNYSECNAGACEHVDYSLDNYVAVNKNSFESTRDSVIPAQVICGPIPGCPNSSELGNFFYTAKCLNSRCIKKDVRLDWVTYTNETWEFSIKHPPGWTVLEDSLPAEKTDNIGIRQYIQIGTGPFTDENGYGFTIWPAPYNSEYVSDRDLTLRRTTTGFIVTTAQDASPDSVFNSETRYDVIGIEEDKNGYLFSFSQDESLEKESWNLLAQKIISTFSFIN